VYNASYLSADLAPEYETTLIGGLPEPGEASSLFIPTELGIQPYILPEMRRSINLRNDRRAYRMLRSVMRELKPTIVHTHASKAGALGRLAAFHERVPITVHTFHGHVFHSYFNQASTLFYKQLERQLAAKTSAIVAISARQKEELCEIHRIAPSHRTHVIPLGFDLGRFTFDQPLRRANFRKKYDVSNDIFAIGIVGRLAAVKNHLLFLEALALLKLQTNIKFRAFIVGDGELRSKIEAWCDALMLTRSTASDPRQSDVVFLSWITDVAQILPGFDAVALTSHNEGTPVSLIEAQAAGVPVVSTRVGGVADILLQGETGLLTRPGSPDDLAGALRLLMEDQDLYDDMARRAPAFALEHFSRERLASDMRALYEGLI
jgi:glycosyltransferase involved in cell wall biosynthesis